MALSFIKPFFILDSTEHEIYPAHEFKRPSTIFMGESSKFQKFWTFKIQISKHAVCRQKICMGRSSNFPNPELKSQLLKLASMPKFIKQFQVQMDNLL